MKVLVLAGAFAAVAFPAAAAEVAETCRAQDNNASSLTDRAEATSAPAVVGAGARPAAPREAAEARSEPVRRRNGKRVPDAELIGPRGAL